MAAIVLRSCFLDVGGAGQGGKRRREPSLCLQRVSERARVGQCSPAFEFLARTEVSPEAARPGTQRRVVDPHPGPRESSAASSFGRSADKRADKVQSIVQMPSRRAALKPAGAVASASVSTCGMSASKDCRCTASAGRQRSRAVPPPRKAMTAERCRGNASEIARIAVGVDGERLGAREDAVEEGVLRRQHARRGLPLRHGTLDVESAVAGSPPCR